MHGTAGQIVHLVRVGVEVVEALVSRVVMDVLVLARAEEGTGVDRKSVV